MARQLHKLNALQVNRATVMGRYGDGGGLYLDVKNGGRKRWIFRYRDRATRKLHDMGLGSARNVTLARARKRAHDARSLLADGKDPIAEAKIPASTIPNFGKFAEEVISSLEAAWRNDKHRAQWRSTLKTYAAPIANKRVDLIDTADILSVLKPIWGKTPETASRVRGRIEKVLDAAKARGFRSGENPARWRGHLDHLLPPRKKLTRGHHPAMPYHEVPKFLKDLRRRNTRVGALALEFTIFTAVRSGETRGACWAEIDFDTAIWTVPGDRMKAGKEHRVPLTTRCMEILDELTQIRSGDLVFPGQQYEAPLSDMSLLAVLRRMGIESATVHGFRSSFKDWAVEQTSFPYELSELALAHTVGSQVERAYRRGDALERRRELMEAWAAFVQS